ncbi:flagellar assembly protein FliH [Virgibacillus alimentarius]|uniref:flagellar assembly protein FliH n=1 Tax=Virgibacillus alimentarius TaxID=698769 RepID=UPI00049325D8|nr:flagellar assembly protein FliH [Virgibacillus alimentarius]
MSKLYSSSPLKLTERVIKIKPIELIKDKAQIHEGESYDSEYQAIQEEIQIGYEKLQKLRKQQQDILNETKAKIEKEKEIWEIEKQSYLEQAKEEGYRAGFELGRQESVQQYEHLLEKANTIIDAAIVDYHHTVEQNEDMILAIAIQTAEKVLKQNLSTNPEAFLIIVKEAIKELKDQTDIIMYLNPDDYVNVLQQKEELEYIFENKKDITLHIDKNAEKGHCLIEHPFGQIDASIDTQLQQIRNTLLELVMENKQ